MDQRYYAMQAWLQSLTRFQSGTLSEPVSASSDASFRQYFRVVYQTLEADGVETTQSWIVMDAPPQHEDCSAFIRVSAQLAACGLQVTEVVEQDLQQGFLLLTDLGDTTYLSVLNEQNADALYRDALSALVTLQTADAGHLASYDQTLLSQEMALFDGWLGQRHCQMRMNTTQQQRWQQVQAHLIRSALAQPQGYVHRDYHSRNLMVTTQRNPGVLDFQDAVRGPLSYDAVSLLRDCYIAWPQEQVVEWQREYFLMLCQAGRLSKNEWTDFVKAMDWMGVQRHLKAAGIFARLYHRDQKSGYLKDIPRTLNYIATQSERYKELHFLADWLEPLMQTFDAHTPREFLS